MPAFGANAHPRRIVVAREAREARRWAAGLRAHGFDAQAFEGLHVQPLLKSEDLRELHARMHASSDLVAVMAVSANAVQAFWNPSPAFSVENSPSVSDFADSDAINFGVEHWVTGPNSAAALRVLGVADLRIVRPASNGAQDSEALLLALNGKLPALAGKRVWIIRGQDAVGTGRPWFAQQLLARGLHVEEHLVYQRLLPMLDDAAIAEAKQSFLRGDTWIFANGAVLLNLCRQASFSADELASVQIRTTHPRIALLARQSGALQVDNGDFGHDLNAWLACLKSVHV